MSHPIFSAPGRLTSGRRTYKGNKLVGGVANSRHLDGTAADFVGTTPAALRAHFGPGVKIIPESDHLHVQGLSNVPYYGNRGIAGLVNGVDTTAPRQAPRPQAAPQPGPPPMPQFPQPNINAPSLAPQFDPSALVANLPQIKKRNNTGQTLGTIAGILGDALMAYGGLSPQFGPAMARQNEDERQMQFDREKFAQMLEMKRQEALAKAQEPPKWLEEAQVFARLSPEQRQMVTAHRDAMYPVIADVTNPDGSVSRKQLPRTAGPMPGDVEDGYQFIGGDPADPKNWRPM